MVLPPENPGTCTSAAESSGDVAVVCQRNSGYNAVAERFRGSNSIISARLCVLGIWNIEGLTDAKVVELQNCMGNLGIGILCLQQTHRAESVSETTDAGFLLVLSGMSDGESCETAGVGFLIAPQPRRNIVSFCQESARMASRKVRVPGGKMTVCSIYAPHSGKPLQTRMEFYHDLSSWLLRRSRHGPLCVLGDFSACIPKRFASDPECIGPYVFGNPNACLDSGSNRRLLLEVCQACNLSVANTFWNHEPRKEVTCYDIGSNHGSVLTWKHFGQIDLF